MTSYNQPATKSGLMNYAEFLENRVVIITGMGRSGTTILGKLIGSMVGAYYLFEPSFMKLSKDPLPILFEDFFVPMVQGRMINANLNDDSYYGHYCNAFDLFNRWQVIKTRKDAVEYIRDQHPKIVIKLTDYVTQLPGLFKTIPGLKVVHIIRNGNDVVNSTANKGWYTKEWMETEFLDYQDNGVPHFINDPAWYDYDQPTRIACIWRTLVRKALDLDVYHIRYESLTDNDLCDYLNLSKSDLTYKHIADFKPRKPYKDIEIQEPERAQFNQCMRELDY